ncbi:MAG: DUF445 family protein [Rhodobacteraceae bacterium]|nr:DUF445 family protein [Paracoccaceae bacterium]
MRTLDTTETEKLAQLRRIKIYATGMLVLCFAVMVLAKVLEHSFPSLAIVVAFTEAATIGGIADWYAVVALFKHPMGLRLPHTAIIPANQRRIGDNMGRFIERNFLADDPIEARLRDIDFASEMSKWLSDPRKSASLAAFLTRFVPQLLDAIDEKGLVQFATQSVTKQLKATDISPLVGDVIDALATERTHNRLMNEVITALHGFLEDEDTLEMIRQRVNHELPTLLKFVPADTLIMRRLVNALVEMTTEIKDDRSHPLRKELETFLVAYVKRLKTSKTFAGRVEALKLSILNRPEMEDMAGKVWASLSAYVRQDVAQDDSALAQRLAELFVDVGERLRHEPDLRRDINDGMVSVLKGLVIENRGEIAAFVSDQVKSWDFDQLALVIEANVGRDLQFIRFNGMLIGGCVGVLLFLAESLLR